MRETTIADRERELRELLDQIEAHPEKAWTAERQRIAVLQRMTCLGKVGCGTRVSKGEGGEGGRAPQQLG